MDEGRWYATAVLLGNGDVLALSGSIVGTSGNVNDLPQVWLASGGWRDLTGARKKLQYYPRCVLSPNGRVYVAGNAQETYYLDTTGAGKWSTGPKRVDGNRFTGACVVYDEHRILFAGGGGGPNKVAVQDGRGHQPRRGHAQVGCHRLHGFRPPALQRGASARRNRVRRRGHLRARAPTMPPGGSWFRRSGIPPMACGSRWRRCKPPACIIRARFCFPTPASWSPAAGGDRAASPTKMPSCSARPTSLPAPGRPSTPRPLRWDTGRRCPWERPLPRQ